MELAALVHLHRRDAGGQSRAWQVLLGACCLALLIAATAEAQRPAPKADCAASPLLAPRPAGNGARVGGRVGGRFEGLPTIPQSWIQLDQESAALGSVVATAGDVNGDGYSDVLLSAPAYDSGGLTDNGAVFVFYGSAAGLPSTPSWEAHGDVSGGQFGHAAATAGDVNADSCSDIVVGHPYTGGSPTIYNGAAYVWYGDPGGLGETGSPANADWSASGEQALEWSGYAVAGVGDFNNDGYGDVVVGAPNYTDVETNCGRVCLFLGYSGGLSAAPAEARSGVRPYDQFGWRVAPAGDVNGDGYGDFIVGAPYADTSTETDTGAVYVYRGNAAVTLTNEWKAHGFEDNQHVGASVCTAGDINGDGYSDIVFGAPHENSGGSDIGSVEVVFGSPLGGLGATWIDRGAIDGTELGRTVACAGDVNGDGYADILVGATNYLGGLSSEGRAYLYYGSEAGPVKPAVWSTVSGQEGALYGGALGAAGDVNGDGYADVIVGAPQFSNGQLYEGMAFVFHGGPDNLSAGNDWTAFGPSDYYNMGFSVSTSGDINGDGYADVIVGAPGANQANPRGAIYVFPGSATGLQLVGFQEIFGTQTGAKFGWAVACAGDVNGDGYGDVLVGEPEYDDTVLTDAGRAHLYYGSPAGLNLTPWTASIGEIDARFGRAVAGAGDVNGDGYADILIGAPDYDSSPFAVDTGKLLVWHGRANGPALGTFLGANWHSNVTNAGAHLGASVATAGDINRDGYSDIIAGGTNFAAVWHGSSTGLPAYPAPSNWFAAGQGANDLFGYSVSTAGDINGDGYSDVIVGAPFQSSNSGGAWAYAGGPAGLSTSACWTDIGAASSAFGWSVACAGDLNGDGYADIVVGAPFHTYGQANEGQARVYYGGPWGPVSYNGGDWTKESNSASASLGLAVGSAGDVNGDGYADVLLGAPAYTNLSTAQGRVYLQYGNGKAGVSLRPRQLRDDGQTPIAPLGCADSRTGFNIRINGRTPMGRGLFMTYVECLPAEIPFATPFGWSIDAWHDTGLTGEYVIVRESFPRDSLNHWRVRLRHTLLRQPLATPYGRWLHMPWNGWNEADLRGAPSIIPRLKDYLLRPRPSAPELDANGDGKIDAADLVRAINGGM